MAHRDLILNTLAGSKKVWISLLKIMVHCTIQQMEEILRWTVIVTLVYPVCQLTHVFHALSVWFQGFHYNFFILVFSPSQNCCLCEKHPSGLAGGSFWITRLWICYSLVYEFESYVRWLVLKKGKGKYYPCITSFQKRSYYG